MNREFPPFRGFPEEGDVQNVRLDRANVNMCASILAIHRTHVRLDRTATGRVIAVFSEGNQYSSKPQILEFNVCEIPFHPKRARKPPSSGVRSVRSADIFSGFREIREFKVGTPPCELLTRRSCELRRNHVRRHRTRNMRSFLTSI